MKLATWRATVGGGGCVTKWKCASDLPKGESRSSFLESILQTSSSYSYNFRATSTSVHMLCYIQFLSDSEASFCRRHTRRSNHTHAQCHPTPTRFTTRQSLRSLSSCESARATCFMLDSASKTAPSTARRGVEGHSCLFLNQRVLAGGVRSPRPRSRYFTHRVHRRLTTVPGNPDPREDSESESQQPWDDRSPMYHFGKLLYFVLSVSDARDRERREARKK